MTDPRPGFMADLTNYAETVLEGRVRSSGDWVDFRCRAHDDSSASCCIKLDSGWVQCQAGTCGWSGWVDAYAQEFGLPAPPDKREHKEAPAAPKPAPALKRRPAKPEVIKSWIYRGVNGLPVFCVDKIATPGGGKRFLQSHWAEGCWWYGTTSKDGKRLDPVLYNMDLLIKDQSAPVYIAEGEKDCDVLMGWGLLATTTMMGAGNGKAEKNQGWPLLAGRDVVIIPDDDSAPTTKSGAPKKQEEIDAGFKHAMAIKKILEPIAKSVKIVRLPGVPTDGGDLSDWVATGKTREDFFALVDSVQELPSMEQNLGRTKPFVVTNGRDPQDVDEEIADHLEPFCGWYVRGNDEIVEVVGSGLRTIKAPSMQTKIQECLALVREVWNEKAETMTRTHQRPTKPIVDAAFTNLAPRLPKIDRIVSTPFFDRSGNLVSSPGYDVGSRTWVATDDHYDVPERPTEEQVNKAKSLIMDELLGEFAWADDTAKAHAFCAALQPFLVDYINDCSPAYLCAANRPNCGKTYLAQCISRITARYGAKEVSESRGPASSELEKRVNGVLLAGDQSIIIDNVKSELEETWLMNYLTAPALSLRRLGSSEVIEVPNRHLWFITANTPKFCLDIARRTVPVNLFISYEVEDPSDREFKQGDLREWVCSNRKRIIEACLTIIKAWFVSGAPIGSKKLGSFKRWAGVMSGICESIGVSGTLATQKRHLEETDESAQERREIVYTLTATLGRIKQQDSKFFWEQMERLGCLPSSVDTRHPDKRQIQQVAIWLSKVAKFNPRIGSYTLKKGRCLVRSRNVFSIDDNLPSTCALSEQGEKEAQVISDYQKQKDGEAGNLRSKPENCAQKTVAQEVAQVSQYVENTGPADESPALLCSSSIPIENNNNLLDHRGYIGVSKEIAKKRSSAGEPISPPVDKLTARKKQLVTMVNVQRMLGRSDQVKTLEAQIAKIDDLLSSPGSGPPPPAAAPPPRERVKTEREVLEELSDELGGMF